MGLLCAVGVRALPADLPELEEEERGGAVVRLPRVQPERVRRVLCLQLLLPVVGRDPPGVLQAPRRVDAGACRHQRRCVRAARLLLHVREHRADLRLRAAGEGPRVRHGGRALRGVGQRCCRGGGGGVWEADVDIRPVLPQPGEAPDHGHQVLAPGVPELEEQEHAGLVHRAGVPRPRRRGLQPDPDDDRERQHARLEHVLWQPDQAVSGRPDHRVRQHLHRPALCHLPREQQAS